jgi:hypothetical protein
MHKTNIIKGYSLDEAKYKRICSVLGVEGDEFPSVMMDDFEMVMGWFKADNALSDADAKARYAEIEKSRKDSGDMSGVVEQAVEAARELIEHEMTEMVAHTPRVVEQIKRQYYAGIYAIAGNVVLNEVRGMKRAYPVLVDESPALPEVKS